MKIVKRALLALAFIASTTGVMALSGQGRAYSLSFPNPGATFAATPCQLPTRSAFFGLPHWYKYLDGEKDPIGVCSVAFEFPNDIWKVVLAIIEVLLWVAGMIAVVMVIVGGFRFMSAMGNTEKTVSAPKTII